MESDNSDEEARKNMGKSPVDASKILKMDEISHFKKCSIPVETHFLLMSQMSHHL